MTWIDIWETYIYPITIFLVGAYTNHLFARRGDAARQSDGVASNFRTLISKEIAVLRAGDRQDGERFEAVLERLNVAAIEFNSTLGVFSPVKRKKFPRLWEEYQSIANDRKMVQPYGAIGYRGHDKALHLLEKIIKMI